MVLGAMVGFFVFKRKSTRHQRGGDPEKNEPLTLRPIASGKFNRKLAGTLNPRTTIQHYCP